jgi:hypothetical protein
MTSYEIGAFEALQWAWHMMKEYKDNSRGISKARKAIQAVLREMGEGNLVNFQRARSRNEKIILNTTELD